MVMADGARRQSALPAPSKTAWGRLRLWALGVSAMALAMVLALPAALDVWSVWLRDYRFAHGPFLLLAAGYLLLRSILDGWRKPLAQMPPPQAKPARGWTWPDRSYLVGGALLYGAAAWLEVEALRPPALLLMLAGTARLLGGRTLLLAVTPALGLLLFALPWPPTLVKSATYSIQVISTLLTAALAPLAGLEIAREGVTLTAHSRAASGDPYTVIVGPGCAGMKYLLALLSLAYLAAYFRGLGAGRGTVLVLAAVPLALLGNALRILIILGLGAHSGHGAAAWAHDYLGWTPFLVTCAGLGWLLRRLTPLAEGPEKAPPAADLRRCLDSSPAKLLSLNAVLALALVGNRWGEADVPQPTAPDSRLTRLEALPLLLPGWEPEPVALSPQEQGLLRPEVARIVRFHAPDGRTAELAVIGGYRKESLHPSGHGIAGPGWRMLSQEPCRIPLAKGQVPALQARMTHPGLEGREVWVTWCFTDGTEVTTSRSRLRWLRLHRKLQGQRPLILLVRVIEPVTPGERPPSVPEEMGRRWLPAILAACRS